MFRVGKRTTFLEKGLKPGIFCWLQAYEASMIALLFSGTFLGIILHYYITFVNALNSNPGPRSLSWKFILSGGVGVNNFTLNLINWLYNGDIQSPRPICCLEAVNEFVVGGGGGGGGV